MYSIRTVTRRKPLQTCCYIPVKFQIDSGSTCSIFTVNVYKDISGDNNLKDLNTAFKPVLSLYDKETKMQTVGT